MTRKTTTVMLEDAGCVGGSAHVIEKALTDVPGVVRAYVNPATEAAYVEYDSEQCGEKDLEAAIESVGVQTAHRSSLHPSHGSTHRDPSAPGQAIFSTARSWWAFGGFVAIAGFFLISEHRAHLFGALPFLFLLACPLLHMFGHGGHGRRPSSHD